MIGHTSGVPCLRIGCGLILVCVGALRAEAQAPVAPVAPVPNACQRPVAGAVVQNPPSLFSANGALGVEFSYQTRLDADGRTLFCFMTPQGLQNPTLHVRPGDHLKVKVTNNTPGSSVQMAVPSPNCGATTMTAS